MMMLPLLLAAAAAPAGDESITVEVTNVRNGRGNVHVDICSQDQFLKEDCSFAAEAPAREGTTLVTIAHVPPGRYAAQVSHDENNNHKVDRGLFGIPKEGIGFSRDAPVHLSPPKWADAVFDHQGRQTITLKLRYWTGASGPTRQH